MTLCTQADIEQRLQWDITAEPEDVVTSLIAAAQAHIEAAVGRALESDSRSQTFDGGHQILFLEHWPVTAVASVTEDGTALTVDDDYVFYDDGRLIRVSGGHPTRWGTTKLRSIEVAYTGGYLSPTHDRQLAHLGSVCTEIVSRAFRQGAANAAAPAGVGLGGITEVSLDGSDSVQFSNPSAVVAELGGGLTRFVFLLEDEKEQLRNYRTPGIA